MIWRKSGVGRDGKMKNTTTFRSDHEYVVIAYNDVKQLNKSVEKPNWENEYPNLDNDFRGGYKPGSISKKEEASNLTHKNYYSVVSPSGKVFTRQFDIPEQEFKNLDEDNRIYWGKNGDAVPAQKIFQNELRKVNTSSLLLNDGTTTEGYKLLNELMETEEEFGKKILPKPIVLMQHLVQIASQPNALILDAFAGSGTTGHATLKLNAEDGGNRKFILIQQPEAIKPETTAHQAGFTTVDAITRERLRRVIDGVPSAKDAQLQQGLGGSFTAVTLGEPINLETLALATDETLPSRENLGRFVFYNTTLQALETLPTENATGYLGETDTHKVYLLYKPERQALTGTTCAFTLERAERIAQELAGTGKEAIVYAPISFVDAKTLKAKKWAIRYCNLPYELLQLNPVKPAPEGLV